MYTIRHLCKYGKYVFDRDYLMEICNTNCLFAMLVKNLIFYDEENIDPEQFFALLF
jgi:hypothetical protein